MNENASSRQIFETNGFIAIKGLCGENLVNSFLKISTAKLNEQLEKLKGKEIGIGSAQGYKEICQRSKGRWDVPLNLEEAGVRGSDLPWWSYISEFLGEDAVCAHQGVVSSAPNTPAQEWHIDSPHSDKKHRPVHAINVLIALEKIDYSMGPTEIAVGSHRHTNHLDNQKLVVDELVYQCPKTSPESLLSVKRNERFETWRSELTPGSVIIFDDRILHRGGENKSDKFRHVAYFSYSRNGYQQESYFESDKTLD
jgi:hypothetical protein